MIRAVVEQHAEEAAVLWLLRDAAALAPHYDLAALADLDDRLDAHLDGLRVAGRGGWALCKQALDLAGPGEIFAAAILAFDPPDSARIGDVLDAAGDSPELARGLVSALGWLPLARAEGVAQELLMSSDPVRRRIGLAALVAHRRDPGRALDFVLDDADPRLRARSLRALGELGRINRAEVLRAALSSEDEGCRFWSAWSSALLGEAQATGQATGVLKAVAEAGGQLAERACSMAVRRMAPRDASEWLRALGALADLARAAVIGAGACGNPADIPWLIECMKVPELARIAGESFATITGIDMQPLKGEPPPDARSGPTDDPDDEDVEMDPDAMLPWPDPAAVARAWEGRRPELRAGVRSLLGAPITPEWAAEVRFRGTQSRRAAAAIELSIRKPGAPLFEVRAPGFRQVRLSTPPPESAIAQGAR